MEKASVAPSLRSHVAKEMREAAGVKKQDLEDKETAKQKTMAEFAEEAVAEAEKRAAGAQGERATRRKA